MTSKFVEDQTSILFYESTKPYYEFSNFYEIKEDKHYKLIIDGKSWKSTEHYYQSEKFRGSEASPASIEYANLIADADTANKAYLLAKQKKLGGYTTKWRLKAKSPIFLADLIKSHIEKKVTLRSDWDLIKDNVMMKALKAKFEQNLHLLELLMSTKNKTLVENTRRDKYWGDGGDGTGLNKLGKMLMIIRDKRENINTNI